MTENLGSSTLLAELKKLNPGIEFGLDHWADIIHAKCDDCSKLEFPKGYYLNGKNGLTNKHNTGTGMYESYSLMTEDDYRTLQTA